VSGIDKTMVGLGNVDNTSDANKPVSTATQTALDLKANLASPTFTGTVSGIDKTMVGLGNVDNTSDANKPVSTATQTALDLKANLASPTFTGTVTAPYFNGDGSGLTNIISTEATNTINSKITEDSTTSTSVYPTFVTASSGDLPLKVASNKLSFNPSTGSLTATIFNGNLNGEALKANNILLGSAGEIPYQYDLSTTRFIPVGTSGQILKSNGTLAPSWVDLNSITIDVPEATETVKGGVKISGDLTGSTYDNLTIANDKITSGKILNANVTYSKIQNVSPNRILGNTSSSSASIQEVEVTGTGKVALNDGPTFINPSLGNASATSLSLSQLTFGFKEVTSSSYSIADNDPDYIKFSPSGTGINSIILPTAVQKAGKRIVITSSLKSVNILASNGETLNGSNGISFAPADSYSVIVVFSDGSNWIIESLRPSN
jgi:hypothetical protein